MALSHRIAPLLLGLSLVFCLTACGAGQEAAEPDNQAAAPASQKSGEEADAAATAEGEAAPAEEAELEFGPYTYQMVTFNGNNTAETIEEYLNSGYSEAAYQLILFDDGGGLLYTGRSVRGVRYRPHRLTIDGVRAKTSFTSERLVVTLGEDTMVFEALGTPSTSRSAADFLVGRYNQLDNTGTVLDRLRLNEGGTGAHLRAGARKRTKVFWGTDPVFGMDYLMIRGVLYEFDYQGIEGSNPPLYTITVHNEQRTRFTQVEE